MSLLRQLLESQHEPARLATSATVATQSPETPAVSQESQESQGGGSENSIHAHLLALAKSEGIDAALVHALTSADMQGCAGLTDAQLCTYLHMLDDTADREAGQLPASYTARALCRHCGPVWLPPAHVAKAPTVGGWPRVLGCPWCHVRPPEGVTLPRPPIRCADCRHFQPDPVNPQAGMGFCQCEGRACYPNERHQCGEYQPRGEP